MRVFRPLVRRLRLSASFQHVTACRSLSIAAESVTGGSLADSVTSPLTVFSQDEEMVRDAARQWAQQELLPVVREMDEAGKTRPDIIQSLLELRVS